MQTVFLKPYLLYQCVLYKDMNKTCVFEVNVGCSLVQDLIDKAQRILVENRNLVQRMQPSLGISRTGEDDAAFTNFKQVIVRVCVFF